MLQTCELQEKEYNLYGKQIRLYGGWTGAVNAFVRTLTPIIGNAISAFSDIMRFFRRIFNIALFPINLAINLSIIVNSPKESKAATVNKIDEDDSPDAVPKSKL